MRYYNNTIASLHRKDMTKASSLLKKQDPLMHHLLKWVPKIVININREYASAGTLDLNDLIAIGNYHLINALNNVYMMNKPSLADIPEAEHAPVIWTYVKKSILFEVKREINLSKDGVRTWREGDPGRQISIKGKTAEEDFVTELFPDFFDEQFMLYHDNTDTMWNIIQLGIGLDEAMDKSLSFDESKLIKLFYGIDQDKKSYKELSKMFRKSTKALEITKRRAIKKLKSEETRKIIQLYYDF